MGCGRVPPPFFCAIFHQNHIKMRQVYTMRKGKIRYQGYQCDIDTLRFVADFPFDTKANRRPFRLECCDSLEVNFLSGHQPREFTFELVTAWMAFIEAGDYAANILLDKFLEVEFEVECWAAVGSPDPYGRSVGFLFAPDAPFTEGQFVAATALPVTDSWNYHAAEMGWMYPAFYADTHPDVRDAMRPAFEAAQSPATGVWVLDSTALFGFADPVNIQDETTIWPPAFRFMMQFYGSRENYTEFPEWCEQNRKYVEVSGSRRTFGSLFDTEDTETGIPIDLLDILFLTQ